MTKDELIQKTIARKSTNPNGLAYVNLDDNNNYRGWVADFGCRKKDNAKNYCLDLRKEKDLFILFFLASAWSRSGRFEASVFFVILIMNLPHWEINDDLIVYVKNAISGFNINDYTGNLVDVWKTKQKHISAKTFRQDDLLYSLKVLMSNWDSIYKELYKPKYNKQDWYNFAEFLHTIKGLGAIKKDGTANAMLIKILLILRELRCQKIFDNIPGEYCCVPDVRVRDAYEAVYERQLPGGSLKRVLRASELIYKDYGDLYDIPLFSYIDVVKDE